MTYVDYSVATNSVILNGVPVFGKKGFPPNSEANSNFQSKPHYVRLKGTLLLNESMCFYNYTYESWFYVHDGRQVNNVEFWY